MPVVVDVGVDVEELEACRDGTGRALLAAEAGAVVPWDFELV
ncbi:MAG: hypothetical protein ACRDYE_06110 [Acidimicrobiales bacterium]